MTGPSHRCPDCDQPLTFVRDLPLDDKEIRSNSQGFSVPLASSIYECPEHGQFRIYISGAVKQYQA